MGPSTFPEKVGLRATKKGEAPGVGVILKEVGKRKN